MSYDLVFDTETSGLWFNTVTSLDKQPKTIEFFGLAVNRNSYESLWEYESLVNIGEKLDPKITKITTISDEMLEDQPSFSTIADRVRDIIEKADRVVAHNLRFDIGIIDFEFSRLGLNPIIWPELLCTVEKTEFIKGHRISLSDLHEFLFDERFDGAHRAGPDVRALAKVYKELLRRGYV